MTGTDGRVEIGLDLGATLAKGVSVEASSGLDSFQPFVARADDRAAIESFVRLRPCARVAVTGAGAARLASALAPDLHVEAAVEFDAWGAGAALLAAAAGLELPPPYLLVSLGTGTSILRVDPAARATRIGGTAVGGGTLRGLGRLLVGTDEHERLVALAARGDRRRVDLLVGDLYGGGEIALVPDLTAANFGRVGRGASGAEAPGGADVAHAVFGLVGETVALLAGALAHGLGDGADRGGSVPPTRPHVLYAGSTLRGNEPLQAILRSVTALVGAEPHFLPHGELAGALGALALVRAGLGHNQA